MYFWFVLVITPVLPPISGDIGEGSRLIGFTLHYSSVHLQKFSADESTESMDSFLSWRHLKVKPTASQRIFYETFQPLDCLPKMTKSMSISMEDAFIGYDSFEGNVKIWE